MNTENINPNSRDIDKKATIEMLTIINDEDKTVANAVSHALPQIADAVDAISSGMKKGGRMIYAGAGTSGRLAIQDAAECTITYGVKEGTVCAIMAGGHNAVFSPAENIEDDYKAGVEAIKAENVSPNDTIVGISASGGAEFVCGVLSEAAKSGACTIALVCNEYGKICDLAKYSICVPTGAEVITGSTRMKAGTAQKMVLNMLSTAAMIKLGKVTGNFMTWMTPTNKKLKKRAAFIVSQICQISQESAAKLLEENDFQIRNAIKNYNE